MQNWTRSKHSIISIESQQNQILRCKSQILTPKLCAQILFDFCSVPTAKRTCPAYGRDGHLTAGSVSAQRVGLQQSKPFNQLRWYVFFSFSTSKSQLLYFETKKPLTCVKGFASLRSGRDSNLTYLSLIKSVLVRISHIIVDDL